MIDFDSKASVLLCSIFYELIVFSAASSSSFLVKNARSSLEEGQPQTFETKPSKIPEYAQVLNYAKQWLLADCMESFSNVNSETSSSKNKVSVEDDRQELVQNHNDGLYGEGDEEDEFEDAVSPPALTLSFATTSQITCKLDHRWEVRIGRFGVGWRQSLVEYQFQLDLESFQIKDLQSNFLICQTQENDLLHSSWVIPSSQARLLGSQIIANVSLGKTSFVLDRAMFQQWEKIIFNPLSLFLSLPSSSKYSSSISTIDEMIPARLPQLNVHISQLKLDFRISEKSQYWTSQWDRFQLLTCNEKSETIITISDWIWKSSSSPLSSATTTTKKERHNMKWILQHHFQKKEIQCCHQLFSIPSKKCFYTDCAVLNNTCFDAQEDLSSNLNSKSVKHGLCELELIFSDTINLSFTLSEYQEFFYIAGAWSSFFSNISAFSSTLLAGAYSRRSSEKMIQYWRNRVIEECYCFGKLKVVCPEVHIHILAATDDILKKDLEYDKALLDLNFKNIEIQGRWCSQATQYQIDIQSIEFQQRPEQHTWIKIDQNALNLKYTSRSHKLDEDLSPELLNNIGIGQIVSRGCLQLHFDCKAFAECYSILGTIGASFQGAFQDYSDSFRSSFSAPKDIRDEFSRSPVCQLGLKLKSQWKVVLQDVQMEFKFGSQKFGHVSLQNLEVFHCGFDGLTTSLKNQPFTLNGQCSNFQITDQTFTTPSFITGWADVDHDLMKKKRKNIAKFVMGFHLTTNAAKEKEQHHGLLLNKIHFQLEHACINYLQRTFMEFSHYYRDVMQTLGSSDQIIHKKIRKWKTEHGVIENCSPLPSESPPSSSFSSSSTNLSIKFIDLRFHLLQNTLNNLESYLIIEASRAELRSSEETRSWMHMLDDNEQLESDRNSMEIDEDGEDDQKKRTMFKELRRRAHKYRSEIIISRNRFRHEFRAAQYQVEVFLHEDNRDELPLAEERLKSIELKQKQLHELQNQLSHQIIDIEDALAMLANTESRSNLREVRKRIRSHSIEDIRVSLNQLIRENRSLSVYFWGSREEDFYDALEEELSLSELKSSDCGPAHHSSGLNFALYDLQISSHLNSTRKSIVDNSAVNGIVTLDTEKQEWSLEINEFVARLDQQQYALIVAIVFENLQERTTVMDDTSPKYCNSCMGHHIDAQMCDSVWLSIPIIIHEGSLSYTSYEIEKNSEKPSLKLIRGESETQGGPDHKSEAKKQMIVELTVGQFELEFALKTSDVLQIQVSSQSFVLIDKMVNYGSGKDEIRDIVTALIPSRQKQQQQLHMKTKKNLKQFTYTYEASWTESTYGIYIKNSCVKVIGKIWKRLSNELSQASFQLKLKQQNMPNPLIHLNGYVPPEIISQIGLNGSLQLSIENCAFYFLEQDDRLDCRVLVALSDIEWSQNWNKDHSEESHLSMTTHGLFFSSLPILQQFVDKNIPLVNSFTLAVDDFIDQKKNHRVSVVLPPIETRVSVHDCHLFHMIAENVIEQFQQPERPDPKLESSGNIRRQVPSSSVSRTQYASTQALGQIGNVRLILMNNTLGEPIADLKMTEIMAEYQHCSSSFHQHNDMVNNDEDDDFEISFGSTWTLNYFNSLIHRWEPFIEPFSTQMRIQKSIQTEFQAYLHFPDPININFTPAFFSIDFFQSGFVTTSAKAVAPFWIINNTGQDIEFSFRRGLDEDDSKFIRQALSKSEKVPLEYRINKESDIESFDTISSDIFATFSSPSCVTFGKNKSGQVNHTLNVWNQDQDWKSIAPVIVDIVGHCAIPLTRSSSSTINEDEEEDFPVLVAEIILQQDGSKLINLHSQVVIDNITSVPLALWMFSPAQQGLIKEHIVKPNEKYYLPLHLIHLDGKVSLRPSRHCNWGPLLHHLAKNDLDDTQFKETKVQKVSGMCQCPFSSEIERSTEKDLLPSFIINDLPKWHCFYENSTRQLTLGRSESPSKATRQHSKTNKSKKTEEQEEQGNINSISVLSAEEMEYQNVNEKLRKIDLQLEEAKGAAQGNIPYQSSHLFMHNIQLFPAITFQNALAVPFAYRLLDIKLQVVAEGILEPCQVLSLFQIDFDSDAYLSIRLNNYRWSDPQIVLQAKVPARGKKPSSTFLNDSNSKQSLYQLPFTEKIERIHLLGMEMKDIAPFSPFHNEPRQKHVPDLDLRLKLIDRRMIIFCSIWIQNFTELVLEYLPFQTSKSKKEKHQKRYTHYPTDIVMGTGSFFRSASVASSSSSAISSAHSNLTISSQFSTTRPHAASTFPIAILVMIEKAKNLAKLQNQIFGQQCPFVRTKLIDRQNCIRAVVQTKPSPKGGTCPQWSSAMQNTLHLRFPSNWVPEPHSRISVEVKISHLGTERLCGYFEVDVPSLLAYQSEAAEMKWYPLSQRNQKADTIAGDDTLDCGQIRMAFIVGTKQGINTTLDTENLLIEREEQMALSSEVSTGPPKSSSPAADPATLSARPRAKAKRTLARKYLRIYLPTNRFYSIFVPISADVSFVIANDLFQLIKDQLMIKEATLSTATRVKKNKTDENLQDSTSSDENHKTLKNMANPEMLLSIMSSQDYCFYPILKARFTSIRSAGRSEAEQWWGPVIEMNQVIPIDQVAEFGLHLNHRIASDTLRSYNGGKSTASAHHQTPLGSSASALAPAASLLPGSMVWGNQLMFCSPNSKRHWDSLKIRGIDSTWSRRIYLQRNASLSSSGGGQQVDESITLVSKKKEYEIALSTKYGVGYFRDTIIATFAPRYILVNQTGFPLIYCQFSSVSGSDVNGPSSNRLEISEVTALHWFATNASSSRKNSDDAIEDEDSLSMPLVEEKFLRISFAKSDDDTVEWNWSNPFPFSSVGALYIKLRPKPSAARRNHLPLFYILQCQIELIGCSVVLRFLPESTRWPPYRIDNRTSFRIQFQQSGSSASASSPSVSSPIRSTTSEAPRENVDENDPPVARTPGPNWDELNPRTSQKYAWDNLLDNSSSKLLTIRFMQTVDEKALVSQPNLSVKQYDFGLDVMETYSPIKLQRSLPSFSNCSIEGYLYKKDSGSMRSVKWNRRYFRVIHRMIYMFHSESEWELQGVIDLEATWTNAGQRAPEDQELQKVVIYEKHNSDQQSLKSTKKRKSKWFSSREATAEKVKSDIMHYSKDELILISIKISRSISLMKRMESFEDSFENKTAGIPGHKLVSFLIHESIVMNGNQAIEISNELMDLGVLNPILVAQPPPRCNFGFFQPEHYYQICPLNVVDEVHLSPNYDFVIQGHHKDYEIRAQSRSEMRTWIQELQVQANSKVDTASSPTAAAATSGIDTKTYVQARVRADGPIKVLELIETGIDELTVEENDHEEEEAKYASTSDAGRKEHVRNYARASSLRTRALLCLPEHDGQHQASPPQSMFLYGLNIHLHSLGISLIDHAPQEVVYLCFSGFQGSFRMDYDFRREGSFTLDLVQGDNQLANATFITLICPHPSTESSDFNCPDCGHHQTQSASIHFCCVSPKELGTETNYFNHCSLWITPMVLQLDESTLASLRQFVHQLVMVLKKGRVFSASDHPFTVSSSSSGIFSHALTELDTNVVGMSDFVKVIMNDELNPLETLRKVQQDHDLDQHPNTDDPVDDHDHDHRRREREQHNTVVSQYKLYFAKLHVYPIEIDITFRNTNSFDNTTEEVLSRSCNSSKSQQQQHQSNLAQEDDSEGSIIDDRNPPPISFSSNNNHKNKPHDSSFPDSSSSSSSSSSHTSWHVSGIWHPPDLDQAPVRFHSLLVEHAFGTREELTKRLTKSYMRQFWKQLHRILFRLDFLGSPIEFLDLVGTGVRDFFVEPLEQSLRLGPRGLGQGLAKGTSSLVNHTLDGTFSAANKITASFGQSFARCSMDRQYQQARRRARSVRVESLGQGLGQGVREFGLGVVSGLSGLLSAPVDGMKRDGLALGLVKGTVVGLVGATTKPLAGVFDLVSRTSQGIGARHSSLHAHHASTSHLPWITRSIVSELLDPQQQLVLPRGQLVPRVRPPRVFGRFQHLRVYAIEDTLAVYLLSRASLERLVHEPILFHFEICQSLEGSSSSTSSMSHKKVVTNISSPQYQAQPNDSKEDDRYHVTFYEDKLELTLASDFHQRHTIVQKFVPRVGSRVDQGELIQVEDRVMAIGSEVVTEWDFDQVREYLTREQSRPLRLTFESSRVHRTGTLGLSPPHGFTSTDPSVMGESDVEFVNEEDVANEEDVESKAYVPPLNNNNMRTLEHWVIVTDQRLLYINTSDFGQPMIEWMTPLRYVSDFELELNDQRIDVWLNVGMNSLRLAGPCTNPKMKHFRLEHPNVARFLNVMWQSFSSCKAEAQELVPTGGPTAYHMSGYLYRVGNFRDVKNYYVLHRDCLYTFASEKCDKVKRILPLGNVSIHYYQPSSSELDKKKEERKGNDPLSFVIRPTNTNMASRLLGIRMEGRRVVEHSMNQLHLRSTLKGDGSKHEIQRWTRELLRVTGQDLHYANSGSSTSLFDDLPNLNHFHLAEHRNIPLSKVSIGIAETPSHIVAALYEALKKTHSMLCTPAPRE